jgi:geranylgeranyl transferase type-2 subunit alpha
LRLVEKMLELDARNFHGWDCRRAVVARLARTHVGECETLAFPAVLRSPTLTAASRAALLELADNELAYALHHIETNFSNFSAWHQRIQLLPHVWTARRLVPTEIDTAIDRERELAKHAMYTDPTDQSVWLYHRWILDQLGADPIRKQAVLRAEVAAIHDLFVLEPDSKWCAQSLAHYKSLLANLTPDPAERAALETDAKALLHRLLEIDPDRAGRYNDLLDGNASF